ncbi:Fic family protein [Agarilytica rhodophyticola]|uniref:Fic family protein n=1 Tax=Agarilytica rhodophyticola TaxID=1737490 RepID=UPI000CD96B4F|nr:Fic family protein [Agarilytica rhodophyticola]
MSATNNRNLRRKRAAIKIGDPLLSNQRTHVVVSGRPDNHIPTYIDNNQLNNTRQQNELNNNNIISQPNNVNDSGGNNNSIARKKRAKTWDGSDSAIASPLRKQRKDKDNESSQEDVEELKNNDNDDDLNNESAAANADSSIGAEDENSIRITLDDIKEFKPKKKIKKKSKKNKKKEINQDRYIPDLDIDAGDFLASQMIRDWISTKAIDVWTKRQFKREDNEAWNTIDSETDQIKQQFSLIKNRDYDVVDKKLLNASNTVVGDTTGVANGQTNLKSEEDKRKSEEAVRNSAAAFDLINNLRSNKRDISLKDLKDINSLFNQGVKSDANDKDQERLDYYGVIGDSRHQMGGKNAMPPGYAAKELTRAINKVNYALKNPGEYNPVAIAAEFYSKFISIHPFRDGNGRTAKALVNLILTRFDLPPAIHSKRQIGVHSDPDRMGGWRDFIPTKMLEKMKPYEQALEKKLAENVINTQQMLDQGQYPNLDLKVTVSKAEADAMMDEMIVDDETHDGPTQILILLDEMRQGLKLLQENDKEKGLNNNDQISSNQNSGKIKQRLRSASAGNSPNPNSAPII